jgi:uncharacterized NAD(P)/FAD-binding protein YdhS
MTQPVIAIVGAGLSGTIVALQFLRTTPDATRIVLIDRTAGFGRGLAYGTTHPGHLLNVPAGRMSAFVDCDSDFLDWLRARPAEALGGIDPQPGTFVPRRLYGDYAADLLRQASEGPGGHRLITLQQDATALRETAECIEVDLDGGTTLRCAAAVLANGNFLPAPEAGVIHAWQPDGIERIPPTDPILLIGTGLTMVDMLITLLDQGHTGPIHAISRRGLMPRAHAAGEPPVTPEALPDRLDVRTLFHHLRRQVAAAVAAGQDWRPVIDSLRPRTQALWQGLPLSDKARFLRHARPWWDVHRHRMAPAIAARVASALESGQLRVHAARLAGRTAGAVTITPRGTATTLTLPVAHVINCTGVAPDITRIDDPLLKDLLVSGTARPDALRLGLDVTQDNAVLRHDGAPSARLFAMGPMTKGVFWEITAVPDIRQQGAALARHLAERLADYDPARKQATPSRSGGTAYPHSATASAHRVRNTHPDGGSDGLGGSPGSRTRLRRRRGSRLGTADSRALV